MVLAIIFLIVALLSVVSFLRQLKFKNILAIVFSAITALSFGFFSIMTIICELTSAPFCS
ncbi:MAG TPA: DUF2759 family protein [Pseudogracilibacillus sp.]|nr:DUF2759 family protein [Pseudogracilibacillus sp.]